MSYSLFGNFVSPFSYMVYGSLTYKNIDFKYNHVDLAKKEQKSAEYLDKNPMGQVPLLVIDDKNIFESISIVEYLDDSEKERLLLPQDAYQKSVIRTLLFVLSGSIIPTARNLFLERLGRITLSDEARLETQTLTNEKCHVLEQLVLKHLDLVLKDNPFMYLFYQGWYNLSLGYPEIKNICPGLEQYHKQIAKNPTIAKIEAKPELVAIRNTMYANHK